MDTPSGPDTDGPAVSAGAVVRDDSVDLTGLFDLARKRRRAGDRLKLIDSGRLETSDLERLCEAGVEVYSSDAARSDPLSLALAAEAARKGKSCVALLVHGPFHGDGARLRFDAVLNLARSGIRFAVADGGVPRDPADLDRLADACRAGGSRLVYYRAGPLDEAIAGLCRTGVWLHLEAAGRDSVNSDFIRECAAAARSAGGGLVVHADEAADTGELADVFASGAFVVFHAPPSDYRDPRRALEERARRRHLPPSAFYLFSEFITS
jgi:hypothetical protein